MTNTQKYSGLARLGLIASIWIFITLVLNLVSAQQQNEEQNKADISRAAFEKAYKVFIHPRCLNCHPTGSAPLQSDKSIPHAMRVQGGKNGKGIPGMKCTACHQKTNGIGKHMPPGAPNWHLPHPSMPLVFQGKTAGQLAKQLKDPKHNGGKTLEQIFEHVSSDPLVLWGWNPGKGRTKPPLSHKEFVHYMKIWIENGAVAPK
ncbi:hypothetical protein [Candidatus Uabimicrobium sp. HlEnr_7]|uniref:hypothetical protein n=1 Tax=Candidatus Uabimicrobium helgolandensis TaxID=3095367 RepID=UPI003557BF1F